MTELMDTSLFGAFLPATIIPDVRLSDEQLETAAEIELDNARIRCERTEQGALRMYAPPPHPIWLMIHIFHRELLRWFGRAKIPGQVAMRRRFFLTDNSMLCPDIAYVSSGVDKRPGRMESAVVLRKCPNFVAEFCPHPRELRWLKDKMLQWLAGGVELGWLLVPQEQCVYVYSSRAEPTIIDGAYAVGQGTWEEFVICLTDVWNLERYRQV